MYNEIAIDPSGLLRYIARMIARMIFAVMAALLGTAVAAQPAAERPLTLYSGYAAGTNTDTALRALADIITRQSGRRVIVENKPGASGTYAATSVMAGRPDGGTLAQAPISVFRMAHINGNFDPRKDLSWIIGVSGYRFSTMVRGDAPWKTWKEMIDYARANPGKFTYATPGQASSPHITMEDIGEREGIKWVAVPYKSGTAVALMGGEVNGLATSPVWSFVDSGQIRVLAVWTEKRNPRLPDVPTLKELGYNLVVSSPWGLAGPKNLSPATVKMLHDTIKKAMDNPEFVKLLDRLDKDVHYMSSEAYAKFAVETYESELGIVKRFGLK